MAKSRWGGEWLDSRRWGGDNRRNRTEGLGVAPSTMGFPRLPDSDVILHSTVTDPVSQEALKMLAAAFRSRYAGVTIGGTKKRRRLMRSQKRD